MSGGASAATGTSPPGTDAWLLLQGDHGRGLIGHGVVVSEQPEAGPHYSEPGKTAMYVQVAFDSLLPLGDQIAAAVLRESVPEVPWEQRLRLRTGH